MLTRSLGKTLRPISSTFKARVRSLYLARATSRSFERALLERCVFEVEDELENRSHDHPQVAVMRAVRNALLDEIVVAPEERGSGCGTCANEADALIQVRVARGDADGGRAHYADGRPIVLRWPHVERVAATIAEKRRKGPAIPPVPPTRAKEQHA